MRTEIGSEFWEIPITKYNNLFPNNTQWFISGRSALKAIIAENDFRTAAMPAWCCDSMIKPFMDAEIEVLFYTTEIPMADVTLVMDFFGYDQRTVVKGYSGVVIRDLTHSIFTKEYDDADYYYGSLRKWAGFWTGGYAWGFKKLIEYEDDKTSYISLRREAMRLKENYISCKSDSKDYLGIFEKAEEELEDIGIIPANSEDVDKAKCLDFDFIRRKRRDNAQVLLDAFKDLAIFPELRDTDCPMFVPIRVKNRNGLRRYLIQKEIYCPVHWPVSDLHKLDDDTKKLYDEELSLVCDQRYDKNDMKRMIKAINEFYGEEV